MHQYGNIMEYLWLMWDISMVNRNIHTFWFVGLLPSTLHYGSQQSIFVSSIEKLQPGTEE